MKKEIKTILFASLIAAMILPFSGMNFAVAEEDTQVEDQNKLDKLKERYDKLQERIDRLEQRSTDDAVSKIAELKERQNNILEKAANINQKYNQLDAETESVDASQLQAQTSSTYGSIDIKRTRTGCDQNTEVAHSYGYVIYGNDRFYLTHNYPIEVSVGSYPNCTDYGWDGQLKIYADNIWNIYEGCYGYFQVTNYATNYFICPGDTFDQGEWWYFETTGYYEGSQAWKMGKQHIL